eukprot:1009773-Karenia_brevis.AAC.1
MKIIIIMIINIIITITIVIIIIVLIIIISSLSYWGGNSRYAGSLRFLSQVSIEGTKRARLR